MQFSDYDFIDSKSFSGKIILTSFPGLNSEGKFTDTLFNDELNLFKNNNCSSITSFVEDSEFEKLCDKTLFVKNIYKHQLHWYHLPIYDMEAPDKDFKYQWETTKVLLKNELMPNLRREPHKSCCLTETSWFAHVVLQQGFFLRYCHPRSLYQACIVLR